MYEVILVLLVRFFKRNQPCSLTFSFLSLRIDYKMVKKEKDEGRLSK